MTELPHAYRGILRELRKSAVTPRKSNKTLVSNFRSIAAQYQKSGDPVILQDMRNALLFLRSQREHKLLLERYNPLVDLTAQERIKATARRVGLDMPSVHKPESA
ncbi:putative complex1_LYR-like protein [Lyophyllum shimeji]|uniref:Complex1_LYR-like protein n=1 Tax=Lyophyllum shimeji TaxID=47721 RepID=A0A9P3UHZ6_LYOSH|nr:putative complex1_LYR-like protein [Lyophyllum shimeji]